MSFNPIARTLFIGALTFGTCATGEEMRAPASPQDLEFFESKVRPVLSQYCYECHGSETQKGGLRLDHINTILAGGDSGPALVAGNLAESRIQLAIAYENVDLQMPPKGILPQEARDARQLPLRDPNDAVPLAAIAAATSGDVCRYRH